MANPNWKALTHLYIGSANLALTTSYQDLIAAVPSGEAMTVEAIFVSNIHASKTGRVTVVHRKGGTDYPVAYNRTVAVRSNINVLLGKPLYLNEGDSVKILAFENSTLVAVAPTTQVDEA